MCPHCGVVNHAYRNTTRPGVWRCAEPECRKDFTVTMRTVMERSKIPLHKWLLGFHLFTASKKGFSAHQLHRTLGVTYRSAWFMAHRIREAMATGGLAPPMGGGGKVVEADETYFGKPDAPRLSPQRKGRPYKNKKLAIAVRSLPWWSAAATSARSTFLSRTRTPSTRIVRDNVHRESRLHTDESRLYGFVGQFASHETVRHTANEYVRGTAT